MVRRGMVLDPCRLADIGDGNRPTGLPGARRGQSDFERSQRISTAHRWPATLLDAVDEMLDLGPIGRAEAAYEVRCVVVRIACRREELDFVRVAPSTSRTADDQGAFRSKDFG